MKPTTLILADRSRAGSGRGGFTFTEILFAVMIMGIGFIMVAAMFPATIRQTQTTMEETQGAVVARAGFVVMQDLAIDYVNPDGSFVESTLPEAPGTKFGDPGRMQPLNSYSLSKRAWNMARGQMIMTQNPRYAWVALYSRDYADTNRLSDYARVIVIAAQSRIRGQFYATPPSGTSEKSDLDPIPVNNITIANLEPRLKANVSVTWDAAAQRSLLRYAGAGIESQDPGGPGAYVVIAYDPTDPAKTGGVIGKSFGRIYQLGNFDANANAWELAPGGEMIGGPPGIADNNITNGTAYILGRGFDSRAGSYAGPVQDIAIYTGFVRVRKVDVKYRFPIR